MFDGKGKYHMNPHHAKMADGIGSKPAAKEPPEPGDDGDGDEGTAVLVKPDGSFHTEGHDGEHAEHPSMHHALAHVAEKHGHSELADHIMQHEGAGESEPEPMAAHSGGMGGY